MFDQKEYSKKHYIRNRDKIIARTNARFENSVCSWEGFIPKEARCEICGKAIFFNSKDTTRAIHFDHRRNGAETIVDCPFNWLQRHKRNPENEKIWQSCSFGFLCGVCNRSLPTKNRESFLRGAIKYMEMRFE